MIRLATAILLLTATAANAEGIGGKFCKTMMDQFTACIYEAGERTGTGGYVRTCAKADGIVQSEHKSAMAAAPEPLKSELKAAGFLWHDVTVSPLPRIGETPAAYTKRSEQEWRLIKSQCERLQGLDSN